MKENVSGCFFLNTVYIFSVLKTFVFKVPLFNLHLRLVSYTIYV